MPSLPSVKLCGLRRREDVLLGLAKGADALGFVHHEPSPRHASLAEIAELTPLLQGPAVGILVVVNARPDSLLEWARQAGVHAVQLCGAESPAEFQGFPLPILRRIGVEPGAEKDLEAWQELAWGFVLDHPAAPGGTGRGVDLNQAASLAARGACLLAGGIDAGNVAERVARVRPWGVDASSRLETSPGVKDPHAVESYLVAAQSALSALGDRQ